MPSKPRSSAFFAKVPRDAAAPVVFDSPHSGFSFPADFAPVASPAEIQTTWDAYVDELCAHVTEAGAALLAARFPRAYIDANRAVNDIDSGMLDTPWPLPTALSEHGARGMGLIRRFALPGVPMYSRRLTVAEVSSRIDDFYLPYRRALQEMIEAAWQRHGVVWHFNCHSMKSRSHAMNRDQGAPRPDFVIGDRGGTTAPPPVTAWVADFFASRGYRVTINDPYRGADIVRTHGDPARRKYSIQVEINRALYLHESSYERNAGFAQVCNELTDLAHAAAEHARETPRRKIARSAARHDR